jgi:hypothetical protein
MAVQAAGPGMSLYSVAAQAWQVPTPERSPVNPASHWHVARDVAPLAWSVEECAGHAVHAAFPRATLKVSVAQGAQLFEAAVRPPAGAV